MVVTGGSTVFTPNFRISRQINGTIERNRRQIFKSIIVVVVLCGQQKITEDNKKIATYLVCSTFSQKVLATHHASAEKKSKVYLENNPKRAY